MTILHLKNYQVRCLWHSKHSAACSFNRSVLICCLFHFSKHLILHVGSSSSIFHDACPGLSQVVIVPHQSELHPTIKDNWIHQNIMCCAVSAQNYAGIPFVELYFIKVPGRGQHPSVVIAVDIQHKGKEQRTMQGDYPAEPLTQITDAVGNATRNWCWKEHQLAQSSSSGKCFAHSKRLPAGTQH